MVHSNSQKQRKLPVSSSDARLDNRGGDIFGLRCSIPLAFLTFNSINTIYRASINGDTPVVVFIVFVYLAYLLLEYCLTELQRSPPADGGPRREALKLAAWILSTAIGFGFACHFSQSASTWMAAAFHAVAFACSGAVFYTYFCCDRGDRSRRTWCRVEKIDVELMFDGAKPARADVNSAGDLSAAAENV